MLILKHNIHTIFIMLGFNCNFKCRYCMQHKFKTTNITPKSYNKDILQFIKKHALINKEKNNDPLNVHFFGGEPLVYFDILKDIVENLKNEYVRFSMVTNGSLINDKTLEFINSNNIDCCISWDGRNTKHTRLIDVFETNKEMLFKLDNLNILGVVSAYTYPKEFIEDISKLESEFKINDKKHLTFGLDLVYDLNNPDKELYNIDFKKIENEMTEMSYNFCFDQDKNTPQENSYINSFIDAIKYYEEFNGTNKIHAMCGNGFNTLNLDLNGNLYICHNNTNLKLSTIYDTNEVYSQAYKKLNPTLHNYKTKCFECEVRFICNGGCMLVSEEERNNFYCQQQKSFYTPVIKTLLQLGELDV